MKFVILAITFANAASWAVCRVLSEVVKRGSFSAAAEALSYTQSAVSQAVARLEAETGATLVVRDRRGVRPTAAGATLVEHAEAIFAQVEAAEADLAAVLGVRGGRLRVASFPSAGATLMPLAVATFRARHPDVSLTLAEGEPEEIAPRLRAGEFDLALLFEFPGVRERPGVGLRNTTLLEDPMHVALPADTARRQAGADARRPARAGLGPDLGVEPVRAARRPLVSGGRLRAERDVRERRLRDRAGAGRGGRRGRADPPARADPRAPRDRRARALAASPARKVVAATMSGPGVAPAAKTMIRVLGEVARSYEDGAVDAAGAAPQ